MKRSIYTLFFLFLIAALILPGAARADCTSPAGVTGSVDYDSATGTRKVCDGTNWKLYEKLDLTGTNARTSLSLSNDTGACDSTKVGRIKYIDGSDLWKYCDGTNWLDFGASRAFVELTDAPGSLIGQANKFVRVNSAETALELVDGTIRQVTSASAPSFPYGLWTETGSDIYYNTGSVGIGTASPDQGKVEVKGGSVCIDTDNDDNASSCIASESDMRLKKNITDLEYSLDTLMLLRPVSFDWRYDDPEVLKHYPLISRFEGQPHSIGLIAQEVQTLVPEAIEQETIGSDEVQYLQLDYNKLVPVMIKAIQELEARNRALESRIEVLENAR